MSSLKEIKTRLNSVRSTRQITSAMKMVASAKLHKAQSRVAGMLPYHEKLTDILRRFLAADTSLNTPYTRVRPVERVAIVAFASNTALCGAFNSNVIKMLTQVLGEYRSLPRENIFLFPVGKKVETAVRKLGYTPQGSYAEMADKPSFAATCQLSQWLLSQFADKQVDRVELIYHHFKSAGVHVLMRETFLPMDLSSLESEAAEGETAQPRSYRDDYIVEPSTEELIADLLPRVLNEKLYTALADSNASEHAARTIAMQTATDNANTLIQDLTKQYNKSRQQAITSELLDIVGGSMK
ncbi:MAG: F0F1 ATP synthase subunit gamma [Prevotellaceae bacterium]|jgi:F-type H+-transporting ATPase subunit gamma|nr:F0F1 ATP synthase subunit gamma [Prevotellaceae bacterium]